MVLTQFTVQEGSKATEPLGGKNFRSLDSTWAQWFQDHNLSFWGGWGGCGIPDLIELQSDVKACMNNLAILSSIEKKGQGGSLVLWCLSGLYKVLSSIASNAKRRVLKNPEGVRGQKDCAKGMHRGAGLQMDWDWVCVMGVLSCEASVGTATE